MVMVVTIKKEGSFKNEHTEELYKCCKYKSAKDFVKLHQWDDYELWGKRKGKAGNENKCELPELNEIFFGTLCVRKKDTDLSLDEWLEWYNEKMGGSELLESESVSEDSEVYSESEYTKEGYLKDDFIVDELIEEEYDLT
jgi:hypothetical protein